MTSVRERVDAVGCAFQVQRLEAPLGGGGDEAGCRASADGPAPRETKSASMQGGGVGRLPRLLSSRWEEHSRSAADALLASMQGAAGDRVPGAEEPFSSSRG